MNTDITPYWRGTAYGRNGLRSGGGRGLLLTPKSYINHVHQDQLQEAKRIQEIYQMENELNNKKPNTANLKRKEDSNDQPQPTSVKRERTNTYSNQQTEAERKLINDMFEKRKQKEILRLRAKRKEYEDFLKEKLKDRK